MYHNVAMLQEDFGCLDGPTYILLTQPNLLLLGEGEEAGPLMK
jgi:hypothetical protein